ncbi:hypothetical protein RB2150_02134 [Rhodobacteraceae bacterium HTCC2150]|nr:hypothetical protein RB2150_02134 [Rhodobacteraceae bacterium HTCC2150]
MAIAFRALQKAASITLTVAANIAHTITKRSAPAWLQSIHVWQRQLL